MLNLCIKPRSGLVDRSSVHKRSQIYRLLKICIKKGTELRTKRHRTAIAASVRKLVKGAKFVHKSGQFYKNNRICEVFVHKRSQNSQKPGFSIMAFVHKKAQIDSKLLNYFRFTVHKRSQIHNDNRLCNMVFVHKSGHFRGDYHGFCA